MSDPAPKNLDRVTFAYKQNQALDPKVQEALSKFDLTGDGKVSTAELMAGADAIEKLKAQSAFLRKLVMVLLGVVVLLLLGMFGLTVLAIDLSKETKIGDGKMLQYGQGSTRPDGLQAVVETKPYSETAVVDMSTGEILAAKVKSIVGEACEKTGVQTVSVTVTGGISVPASVTLCQMTATGMGVLVKVTATGLVFRVECPTEAEMCSVGPTDDAGAALMRQLRERHDRRLNPSPAPNATVAGVDWAAVDDSLDGKKAATPNIHAELATIVTNALMSVGLPVVTTVPASDISDWTDWATNAWSDWGSDGWTSNTGLVPPTSRARILHHVGKATPATADDDDHDTIDSNEFNPSGWQATIARADVLDMINKFKEDDVTVFYVPFTIGSNNAFTARISVKVGSFQEHSTSSSSSFVGSVFGMAMDDTWAWKCTCANNNNACIVKAFNQKYYYYYFKTRDSRRLQQADATHGEDRRLNGLSQSQRGRLQGAASCLLTDVFRSKDRLCI